MGLSQIIVGLLHALIYLLLTAGLGAFLVGLV
jgi:hypothetical protein